MNLDLCALARAIGQLESALMYCNSDLFAFADSGLPWMVDMVDMQRIGGIFRQNMERGRVALDWRMRGGA